MVEEVYAIELALLETLLQLLPPSPSLAEFKALIELLSRLQPSTLQTLPVAIEQQLQDYVSQAYLLNWQSDVLH